MSEPLIGRLIERSFVALVFSVSNVWLVFALFLPHKPIVRFIHPFVERKPLRRHHLNCHSIHTSITIQTTREMTSKRKSKELPVVGGGDDKTCAKEEAIDGPTGPKMKRTNESVDTTPDFADLLSVAFKLKANEKNWSDVIWEMSCRYEDLILKLMSNGVQMKAVLDDKESEASDRLHRHECLVKQFVTIVNDFRPQLDLLREACAKQSELLDQIGEFKEYYCVTNEPLVCDIKGESRVSNAFGITSYVSLHLIVTIHLFVSGLQSPLRLRSQNTTSIPLYHNITGKERKCRQREAERVCVSERVNKTQPALVTLRRHEPSIPWGFRLAGGVNQGQPFMVQKTNMFYRIAFKLVQ
ncbi:unnamed protein product [Medioppia subpectinata]|uniref:Uncharacterized protein n=1 Tax=Medioppia subpectinata TaxID=1979941 RepID=A0A7R9KHC7_9ACAR|nr:unnamed protein product [Medioppia subpectinata]CAG2102361.1 unnamed protein product [Medioppia subpectinata]